jgi:hypothetical protein
MMADAQSIGWVDHDSPLFAQLGLHFWLPLGLPLSWKESTELFYQEHLTMAVLARLPARGI